MLFGNKTFLSIINNNKYLRSTFLGKIWQKPAFMEKTKGLLCSELTSSLLCSRTHKFTQNFSVNTISLKERAGLINSTFTWRNEINLREIKWIELDHMTIYSQNEKQKILTLWTSCNFIIDIHPGHVSRILHPPAALGNSVVWLNGSRFGLCNCGIKLDEIKLNSGVKLSYMGLRWGLIWLVWREQRGMSLQFE